jgi:hypothetical protein
LNFDWIFSGIKESKQGVPDCTWMKNFTQDKVFGMPKNWDFLTRPRSGFESIRIWHWSI